ncbi:hypothetical protein Celaphus_00015302 [Cervus elaphus hippelaphus]|uniref:Uncharacterized protein n=1 Tax=Cervus elaphus hippelaphus TaxID=46360 RepID=A0A212CSY4_CEREH|nr:hypothetical protein Celaphus_00015302 [Cervus elaphus hippelaphus]
MYRIGDLGPVISISKSKVEEGYNHFLDNEILQKNYQHLPKTEIFVLELTIVVAAEAVVTHQCHREELCKEFHKLLKNMIHSDSSERTSAAKVKFSVSPWGKTEEFQQQLSLERFKRVTLERRLKEAQLTWSLKKCLGVPGVTGTPTESRSTICLLGGKSAKSKPGSDPCHPHKDPNTSATTAALPCPTAVQVIVLKQTTSFLFLPYTALQSTMLLETHLTVHL